MNPLVLAVAASDCVFYPDGTYKCLPQSVIDGGNFGFWAIILIVAALVVVSLWLFARHRHHWQPAYYWTGAQPTPVIGRHCTTCGKWEVSQ